MIPAFVNPLAGNAGAASAALRAVGGFEIREVPPQSLAKHVREAIAVEKAGLRVTKRKTSEFPVPEELKERFRKDPRFKRAFEALTPGRQRSYLYHFAAAKQSATRVARIEKARPAIFEGRGFLERR